MSDDAKFIADCASGKDAYATIASIAFKVPYEDCLEFYLDENGNKTHNVNKEGKERAKLTNKKKHNEIRTSITPVLRKAASGDVFLVRLVKKNGSFIPLTIHKNAGVMSFVVLKEDSCKLSIFTFGKFPP